LEDDETKGATPDAGLDKLIDVAKEEPVPLAADHDEVAALYNVVGCGRNAAGSFSIVGHLVVHGPPQRNKETGLLEPGKCVLTAQKLFHSTAAVAAAEAAETPTEHTPARSGSKRASLKRKLDQVAVSAPPALSPAAAAALSPSAQESARLHAQHWRRRQARKVCSSNAQTVRLPKPRIVSFARKSDLSVEITWELLMVPTGPFKILKEVEATMSVRAVDPPRPIDPLRPMVRGTSGDLAEVDSELVDSRAVLVGSDASSVTRRMTDVIQLDRPGTFKVCVDVHPQVSVLDDKNAQFFHGTPYEAQTCSKTLTVEATPGHLENVTALVYDLSPGHDAAASSDAGLTPPTASRGDEGALLCASRTDDLDSAPLLFNNHTNCDSSCNANTVVVVSWSKPSETHAFQLWDDRLALARYSEWEETHGFEVCTQVRVRGAPEAPWETLRVDKVSAHQQHHVVRGLRDDVVVRFAVSQVVTDTFGQVQGDATFSVDIDLGAAALNRNCVICGEDILPQSDFHEKTPVIPGNCNHMFHGGPAL
ncbi:E3 ubiquitin-protein ligase RNF181-like, partial [Durusdinium trenchii]